MLVSKILYSAKLIQVQWKWPYRTIFKGYKATSFLIFLFHHDDVIDDKLKNHEHIHLYQLIDSLLFAATLSLILYCFGITFFSLLIHAIWFHYVLLGINLAINYLLYKDEYTAYRNMLIEREAHCCEAVLDYHLKRMPYSVFRYSLKKYRFQKQQASTTREASLEHK